MFSKIKKYVIGFFVLCGGILVAFLSGKSAGKKDEKLKGLKKDSKRVSNALKGKKKSQKAIKKSLENRKKAIKEIKNKKYKKKKVSNKEAKDFLKNFSKEKK
jgi:septal ring factor EnvC (AmiA/AmiB activator)